MLSTLVHIKDKNELEKSLCLLFFHFKQKWIWLNTIGLFPSLQCLKWELWSPPGCLHRFRSVLLARILSESQEENEI